MNIRVFEVPRVEHPVCLSDSHSVYDSMKPYAKGDREMLILIFMNAKNMMTGHEIHTVGSGNSSAVYPDEVFRSALIEHAQSLVVVHNHPSGDPGPSQGDNDITRRLVLAGTLLNIKVLDHIILGDGRFYSYADEGKMADYERDAERILR